MISDSIEHTTDSPTVKFGPLEPDREPGYEAVRALLRQWGRSAYENGRIWRAVEAFGDAMPIPSRQQTLDRADLIDHIRNTVWHESEAAATAEEVADGIIARLQNDPRLDAVRALHRKQTRYMPHGWDNSSFDSEEAAREAEDATPEDQRPLDTFDVCAECARVEWESVDQQTDGYGAMGLTSDWPCRTAIALGVDPKAGA